MPKIERYLQLKNDLGLHVRPATVIVKLLSTVQSQVTFTYKKQRVNAKSILGILMLAAEKNAKIRITIEGEDAEETMNRLQHAFETHFDEGVNG